MTVPLSGPAAHWRPAVRRVNSSRNLCELCLNPAVGKTQRIYEAYYGVGPAPKGSLP